MVTLNALWFARVTEEMEDRDAKLLKTLSDATDMLAKADEIQVTYTEQIREAREKASEAVKDYRAKTEAAVNAQVAQATAERDKKAAAEAEIATRQAAFVKETLAAIAL